MDCRGTSALTHRVLRDHAVGLRHLLLRTCLPLAVSLLVLPASQAQSPYLPTHSDVTVDLSVLDALGPPPTVPGLLLRQPAAPLTLHSAARHHVRLSAISHARRNAYVRAHSHRALHPRGVAHAQSHRHLVLHTTHHPAARVATAEPIKLRRPAAPRESAPVVTAEAAPMPAPLKLKPLKLTPPAPRPSAPVTVAEAKPPERPLKLTRPAPKSSAPVASSGNALSPAVMAALESPPEQASPAPQSAAAASTPTPHAAATVVASARPTASAPVGAQQANPAPPPQTASLAEVAVPANPPPSDAQVAIPVVAPAGLPSRISVARFDAGVSEIPPDVKPLLDSVAARLLGSDGLRLQLVAYASGSDNNDPIEARRISLARAVAVRAYLIEKGVHSFRMDVRALGNRTDGGGPPDRVDLIILDR